MTRSRPADVSRTIEFKTDNIMSVLVGKLAPDFDAAAVVNGGEFEDSFSLSQFRGKYVVLFFYPLDFTFVCPTEIIAFQDKLAEFEKRETQVIGVSVDSKFSHWAWLNMPRSQGGIQGVTYPLVADLSKTISANYDVLAGEYVYEEDEDGNMILAFAGVPQAYRGLFLIDREGVVRHQVVNDMPLGRNIDEAIRMVDALRHNEEYGEVCPANWSEGKDAMTATAEGVASYLSTH
jgi:peroxiredoxin (alkyl hydroperoxide reductase subunit C)